MQKENYIEDKINTYILEHYEKLYRIAYSYMRNREDAMDVVQESAYKAIKSYKRLKEEDYVGSWVCRIVINTALDTLRKSKKEIIGLEEYETGREDTYEDTDVLNALDTLTPKERAVIILRFFEEQKLNEIALILNEPASSVKSRLYRALKKLKVVLADDMEELV